MKKETLFDLASMPKMVLVVTLIVMLGVLFGATSYLLKIPKINLPIINPIIETQCEIDSDCELAFTGSDICLPCDTSIEEYKCLPLKEAKKIEEERFERMVDNNVFCERCLKKSQHTCKCEDGKCEKVKEELVEEVVITTDKTEYEQGETVEITVKNSLNNPIKHLKGVGCSLRGFSDGEWINASSRSCKWDGEDKLNTNSEYNFNWTASKVGLEKYRIAFRYREQEVLDTGKKIGKIVCENIPDELEELLLNGKWIMGDVLNKGCAMCDACGCSCTMKNAWAVGEAVIDIHLVSCDGNTYTIKYKSEEYNCVSENYRQQILAPSENWETIYSNEFTIKEKSALDPRCSEKVKDVGLCEASMLGIGYEFNSDIGKCVKKMISGCSIETPFESLEECQEVCEKKENVVFPDENELIKCGNDNDCALVNSGCCGCSMGGGVTCINKKYLGDWSQKLRLDCEGSIVCPAVYLCDTNPTGCECINNICRGTGGDLTKL